MRFLVPCSSLKLLVDRTVRLKSAAFRLVRAAKSFAQTTSCYRNKELQDAAFQKAGLWDACCCPVAFDFEFLARFMLGDLRQGTIRLQPELFKQELANGDFTLKCHGSE